MHQERYEFTTLKKQSLTTHFSYLAANPLYSTYMAGSKMGHSTNNVRTNFQSWLYWQGVSSRYKRFKGKGYRVRARL